MCLYLVPPSGAVSNADCTYHAPRTHVSYKTCLERFFKNFSELNLNLNNIQGQTCYSVLEFIYCVLLYFVEAIFSVFSGFSEVFSSSQGSTFITIFMLFVMAVSQAKQYSVC